MNVILLPALRESNRFVHPRLARLMKIRAGAQLAAIIFRLHTTHDRPAALVKVNPDFCGELLQVAHDRFRNGVVAIFRIEPYDLMLERPYRLFFLLDALTFRLAFLRICL